MELRMDNNGIIDACAGTIFTTVTPAINNLVSSQPPDFKAHACECAHGNEGDVGMRTRNDDADDAIVHQQLASYGAKCAPVLSALSVRAVRVTFRDIGDLHSHILVVRALRYAQPQHLNTNNDGIK